MNKLIDLLKNNPDIINWNVDRWEDSPQWTSITICYKKEVVEEPKKTLWDKSYSIEDKGDEFGLKENGNLFLKKDVKEALKEFIEWEDKNTIKSGRHHNEIVIRKQVAKEIFGEEMLK